MATGVDSTGTTSRAGRRQAPVAVGAVVALLASAGSVLGSASPAVAAPAPAPVTFIYTGGEQTYSVPAGATGLRIHAVGAHGVQSGGADIRATIQIPAGLTTLYVEVGGSTPRAWGGAGDIDGITGPGGGASGVQTCSQTSPACVGTITGNPSSDPRMVVAGGGGGGGGLFSTSPPAGGDAGVVGVAGPGAGGTGQDTEAYGLAAGHPAGFGGTAGGAGGAGSLTYHAAGTAGSAGRGGHATQGYGGPGGGGWFGGGGGGDAGVVPGGGGAGSSFWPASATETSMTTDASGVALVTITPIIATTTTVASDDNTSVSGQAVTFTATVSPTTGSGTLTFSDGGTALAGCGAVALNSAGEGSCTTSALAIGTHTIFASFTGDDGSGGGTVLLPSNGTAVQFVGEAVQPQTITFDQPGAHTFGDAPFAVSASASSGLPVSFSIASGPCTGSGSTVTITGVGTCVVAADQAGTGNFSAAAQVRRDVTVNRAALTITASNVSSTYGSTAPAITASYSGFVNGDGPSALSVAPTCTSGTSAATLAGSYPTSCSGAAAANYAISYVNGTLAVNRAALTITASSATSNYGQAPPAITASYSGFVNGEGLSALSATPSCGSATSATTPAGTYPTSCSGAAAANYAIGYVNGTLTVNKAPLSITASNATSTYGQVPPAITAAYSGFVNGEGPAALSTGPTCTSGASAATAAGTSPTSCSGAVAANYAVSYVNGTLTINKAPLTITASNATSTYGDVPPAITPSYSGFVNGEGPSALSSGPGCIAGGSATSPAGTYATSCFGAAAANYAISYVNGTLTVNKRPLTLSAQNTSKAYGSQVPALTSVLSGFVNGDTASVVNGVAVLSTTAMQNSGVGTYPITVTPGTLSAANYTFTPQNGTLTVTPAPLTVRADDKSKVYFTANPPLTYTITGFVLGENASVVSGAPVLSTGASQSSDAGTYPITVARGTLAAANYSFDTFVPGTLSVTPAATTLEANAALLRLLPPRVTVGQVSARLTFSNPALAVAGQPVVFRAGNTTLCTGTTNAQGTATCTMTVGGSAALIANNGFTATFAGSRNFLPSTGTAPLIG